MGKERKERKEVGRAGGRWMEGGRKEQREGKKADRQTGRPSSPSLRPRKLVFNNC